MFALIANGPNLVSSPALVFPDQESAEQFLAQFNIAPNKFLLTEKTRGKKQVCDLLAENEDISGAFFTDYYGGCGEVGSFSIRKIEFGAPIAGWNLD